MRSFTYRSQCSGEVKVLVNQPLDEEIRRLLERYTGCVLITPSSISGWLSRGIAQGS